VVVQIKFIIFELKVTSIQYVSIKIKPRQWISFISVLFYWIHTVDPNNA